MVDRLFFFVVFIMFVYTIFAQRLTRKTLTCVNDPKKSLYTFT